MKINIKRIDKSLPLPKYQTKGSVAFDLYSRKDLVIKPKNLAYIPTNLIIKIPSGYMLIVAARSSTPKMGLLIPHGIGIIDQDFHGQKDEILYQVYNFSNKIVKIKKGERIGQAIFVKISKVGWREIKKVKKNSRGGFGGTGK